MRRLAGVAFYPNPSIGPIISASHISPLSKTCSLWGNTNNAFERMGSQRRRVVGMIKYLATEKDCIGEAGEPAECVICFEEFEQGVEMGRLECLCKFHKVGHQDDDAHDWILYAYIYRCCRHVYANGGILRAQVHVRSIRVDLHECRTWKIFSIGVSTAWLWERCRHLQRKGIGISGASLRLG